MSSLLVLAPLGIERLALGARPGTRVLRTGMGPARARIAAARAQADGAAAVAVAGLCAGAAPGLRAGDVLCATTLVSGDGARMEVPGSALLAVALRRRGLSVCIGPLFSSPRLLGPGDRHSLPDEVLGVDMESAWLAPAPAGRPFAVVRVVVDAAGRRLADPRTLLSGPRALVSLRRVGGALAEWAAASGPRRVLLAGPGASASGAGPLTDIVHRPPFTAQGAPVGMPTQIVHNDRFAAGTTPGPAGLHARGREPGGAPTESIRRAVSDEREAVRALAREADLVLVAGSRSSAEGRGLLEQARTEGARSQLVEGAAGVDVAWLNGAATVAVVAATGVPQNERAVEELIGALASLGPVELERRTLELGSPRPVHPGAPALS